MIGRNGSSKSIQKDVKRRWKDTCMVNVSLTNADKCL